MVQNWFPGHMKKALVDLESKLSIVDVVIEIADARAPITSRNQVFAPLIKNKTHILVLTKCDWADQARVLTHVEQNQLCLLMSKDTSPNQLYALINQVLEPKIKSYASRGARYAPRALIIGIPNVGKSTLINKMMKKGGVKVENRPGVTRGFTFINLEHLLLIDSPGILPPKFDNALDFHKLLAIGCIKDSVGNLEECGAYLLDYLLNNYQQQFLSRYQVDLNQPILEQIAARRGIISTGDDVKVRTYELLVREFRNGKIGKISLE